MADMFDSNILSEESPGSPPTSATVQPQPADAPVTFKTNEAGEIVWGEEGGASLAGDQPLTENKEEKPSLFPGLSDEDVFDFDRPDPTEQQYNPAPAQQQQQHVPPPADQMPPDYDPALLDPTAVTLREQQIKTYFDTETLNIARNLGQYWNEPSIQGVVKSLMQTASAGAIAALRMKSQYGNAMVLAHQLHQQTQTLNKRIAPYERVRAAQMVAEKYGVEDYKNLLKHPQTGKPIRTGQEMITVASLIGEAQRQQKLSARQGVDSPMQPTGGRGGPRSLANLSAKEFDALVDASLSGKTIRVS